MGLSGEKFEKGEKLENSSSASSDRPDAFLRRRGKGVRKRGRKIYIKGPS